MRATCRVAGWLRGVADRVDPPVSAGEVPWLRPLATVDRLERAERLVFPESEPASSPVSFNARWEQTGFPEPATFSVDAPVVFDYREVR